LYGGVRNMKERRVIHELISVLQVIPLSTEICMTGGLYRSKYYKSHGCGLLDCLIAASVESIQGCLVSLNQKHFPMLEHVRVPYSST